MPLVRVTIDPHPSGVALLRSTYSPEQLLSALRHACKEIVPAGMTSLSKPIMPGDIQFLPNVSRLDGSLSVNALIEIEALWREDRQNLDERAQNILEALRELFPRETFDIWITLVRAGVAGDNVMALQGDFDMSMEAAIERVRTTLGYNS